MLAADTHTCSAPTTLNSFCSPSSPHRNHAAVADTMQGPEQIRAKGTQGKLSHADSCITVTACPLVSSKPVENELVTALMHLASFKKN